MICFNLEVYLVS